MAFTKMKSVCDLEERHGVSLGTGYKNDHACATFIEFIAKEQQQILTNALSKSNFFSLQAYSSVDAGHIELELFLVSYPDTRSMDGKVHVFNNFFCAQHLKSGTGRGLFESVCKAAQYMNITDWKKN